MGRNAGISARISGDPRPLKQAQDTALNDTQAWVNKMVGLNSSIQKSYSSLAFSGPMGKGKSPIAQLAEEDAKAWARRMSDTQKHTQAWGRQMSGGAGMAVLQTAQAVDDLQYGFKGVLNNIPGLVMSLGGGAGLAGVLALVAVGAATVGKKFWDWWVNAERLKEVTAWVDEMNVKLKEAAATSAKEALEGTAAGAEKLAAAVEHANEAFSEHQQKIAAVASQTKEMVQAEAELNMAKAGDKSVGGVQEQRRIEVAQAKALHAATIEQLKAEAAAQADRAEALDDYAKKAEAAAAAARGKANGLDPGAEPFIKETTINKAAAAEVDAAAARAVADKAHNDSLREQQRISEEIAHRQKVHAKELELIWLEMDDKVQKVEESARKQADSAKEAQQKAAAAADDKRRSEEQAAQAEKRRKLEDMQSDLEKKIRERDRDAGAGEEGPGRGGDAPDRSRRINARARKARPGFGVDDVHRYQRSSLRGDMDAAIGPVGNRKGIAATDRQAHQMQVQKANQGGDPLLAALTAVKKELEQINQNTAGMQKSKSEPLTRQ